MPCYTPFRGDSSQLLLFKIASCCFDGSGVTSFNGRDGAVTLLASDVTPVADDIYVNETGDSMSGLLDITTSATSLQAITSDAGAANTPLTLEIYHKTSAVPLAGFGNRLQFYADTNGADNQIQARIDAQWVDAVDATRSSRLVFGTRNTGGVISSPLILTNGQLQLLDGLATIPSLSFQNDTDTGFYRIGANSIGSSAGGSVILATSTTGINLTDALAYQYNSVNVIRAQTALNNYFFGPSGNLTMTGASNTSVGASAFTVNTSGVNNTAVGFSALLANTSGSNNTSIGFRSLMTNTTGSNNTGVGRDALATNTTGNNSTAVGYEALFSNTTGISNSALGLNALKFNTTGNENTAAGMAALISNTTGNQNSAFGRSALGLNTTGTNNTAIGYLALQSNTIGDDNSAIGRSTLFFNTSGSRNTGLGFDALQFNSTGNNNTSSGYQSLNASTTGSNNTANGALTLFTSMSGGDNSAFGGSSLFDLTTGSSNTAVGFNTGRGITTGGSNTIVGANVAGLAAALSNNIILADGAGVIRIQVDSAGVVTIPIALSLSTAAPLSMVSGANQRAGNVVLIAGTRTVANTTVTANTRIYLTRKVSGGTIGFAVTYTVIAATSFTITSDNALDTSTYSYLLIEVP